MAATAMALVRAFTDADQAWAYHTQVCADQRELYGCNTCAELNQTLSTAKRAMQADPAAAALYAAPQMEAERKAWYREVFRPLADSFHDDY
jgi:hypothetical protein